VGTTIYQPHCTLNNKHSSQVILKLQCEAGTTIYQPHCPSNNKLQVK